MAKKVELLINGSPYTVWCKEEDEDKIFRLGTELENRTAKIAKTLRPDSEAHALFLTSLVLLSEVDEKNSKEKAEAERIAEQAQTQTAQEESYKKEINAFKAALEAARDQVALMANRTEKVLSEVKTVFQKQG